MLKVWVRNGIRIGGLLLAGAVLVAAPALAGPRPGAQRRTLNLFAGILGRQNANQFDCGLNAFGEVCVDPNGSTTVGGGFWPKGTPDQYVFNSGLQVAGIVDPAAGFGWAGDTVGAFFFDPKGTTVHGDKLSLVWSSINSTDAQNWPRDAYVADTSLFASVLQGRKAASQQDSWIQYWDGNPANNSGRKHPIGVLVTQRGMAWNFPTGNEAIIYYLYTFTNISASDPAVYAGLPNADTLASIGARFHALNNAAFGVTIPPGGYTITNMYAAFAMDADVTDEARKNYTSAFLPFNMGFAYKGTFFEAASSGYKFLPPIFGGAFAQTVGFVGVKYLKSPLKDPNNPSLGEAGLSLYSATINGGQFDDAQTTVQLWRYLSAKLSAAAGDAPCSTGPNGAPPSVTHVCYVPQATDDIRFFQSSGPLTLLPGQSQTIVVAYIAAAPVEGPQIAGRSNSFDLPPRFPALDSALVPGHTDTLRSIDHVIGATSIVGDTNLNGKIDQYEVNTVPRSLLNKGLVAQAVFDAKFLLPFPPEPPEFFLVPGDNQVTVVWRPSVTETEGDPYYVVASNNTLPIYDANYRQIDVEGYRIYRGRTTGDLQVIAQFDYANTEFIDYTAIFNYGNCAPELGVVTDCPADLGTGHSNPLVGDVVTIPPGGRVKLANGNVLIVQADTAVTGGASGKPGLTDNGVPFAFVDKGVRNSFRYFYAVTAFDVNSVASVGVNNTSLESAPATKTVTPRAPSSATSLAVFTPVMAGEDGVALNPRAAYPKIDATTGTFNGNMPPSNGGAVALPAAVAEFLNPGDAASAVVDSVTPGFVNGIGVQPVAHLTFAAVGGDIVHVDVPLPESDFNAAPQGSNTFSLSSSVIPYNTGLAGTFGVRAGFADSARMPLTFSGTTVPTSATSPGLGVIQGRYGPAGTSIVSRYLAHSRWFDQSGAEPPQPTVMGYADTAHNSGKLTGVGRIWSPQPYRDLNPDNSLPAGKTRVNVNFRGVAYGTTTWYPADFVITWNADSSITVRDTTHHVVLPFVPGGGAGWGFVNVRAFTAAGLTAGDLADGTGAPVIANVAYQHFYATGPTCYPDWWAITCIAMEQKAQFEPLDFNSDGTADGNGIAILINNEPFMMEMNAIPAAGTKWHLRAVAGDIEATCAPALGPIMTSCSGYSFTGFASRASLVPGVKYAVRVTQQYHVDSTNAGDLSNVHTVPDPYYVTNAFEQSSNDKILKFVNLPSRCIVRIYTVSGVLVNALTLNDVTGGGELTWNLRNRNNQFVASGVYFYHVETSDGKQKVGRFTVVNFAQ